jgi:hypothetical protein
MEKQHRDAIAALQTQREEFEQERRELEKQKV